MALNFGGRDKWNDQPRVISRFGNDEEYWKKIGKNAGYVSAYDAGNPYIYQREEIGMTNMEFTSLEQFRDIEALHVFLVM